MPAVRSVGIVKAGKYEGLYKYLAGRYAGSVVLTFTQIEDLIGSPLVEAARLQSDWWSNEDGTDPQHVQAKAWMKANRSASVNLGARTVLFERFAD